MNLTSNAFLNNNYIPCKYTCDGVNISPQLEIKDIPQNAKSLVLIVDDPDAPIGTFVHCVVYNIPINKTIFKEGELNDADLLEDAMQGKTDFGTIGYGGPCPPGGTHRYFFKLYALDVNLNLEYGASKKEVETAMKGHIISQTELIGLYKRN